jgi:hypothetical protein
MSSERPPQRPVMAQKILQQSREAESALADALVCLDHLESRNLLFPSVIPVFKYELFLIWFNETSNFEHFNLLKPKLV